MLLDLDEREYADLIAEKPVKTYEDVLLSGREILELMTLNASVRVFERVGTAPRRDRQEDTSSAKPDIFSDWVWPKVLPKDLYLPTFGGSDYQWLIVSQPQTGTHIHQDPVMTDAWNALLSGHKVQNISAVPV